MTTCEHGFYHALNGDVTAMVLLAEWARASSPYRGRPTRRVL